MRAVGQSLATLPVPGRGRRDVFEQDDDGCATNGRVLVVEEHSLMADGLRLALTARAWDVETTRGPTAGDVIEQARRFQPHCVLLDIHLRNGIGNGIDLVGPLVSSGAQVVMLTAERRRTILAECLEAGAAGWIGTGAGLDEVDATLGHVVAGGSIIGRTERAELLERLRRERERSPRTADTLERLTQREALVLGALTDGLTADEIAQQHFVALTTVRSQIRAVLQKLGVRSQLAAVAVAREHPELLPHRGPVGRDRRSSDARDRGRIVEYSAHIA